jgi:hypothetical protein
MRTTLLLSALLATTALAVKSPEPYADWGQSQLKGWLQVRAVSPLSFLADESSSKGPQRARTAQR